MAIDPTTTPYSGDPNSYPETSYLPTDATKGKSQTFNTPYQALFDRTATLQRALLLDPPLVPLFGAQQTEYEAAAAGSPIVPRFTPWPAPPIAPPPADFGRAGWLQTDKTDGGGLWWWIPIRTATKITMVAASIMGDDGPGTNPGFPAAADRPLMRLYRQPIDGSDVEKLLTLADETGSKAEYEAHHTIPLDPGTPFMTPIVLSAGEYLLIEFVGHKGANVADNTLKLYGIKITPALP